MATRCAMWRAALAAITYQQRIFPTCYGTEFCGTECHPYELNLDLNGIEHHRTKVKAPKTNSFV